jgi:hypothetical protein
MATLPSRLFDGANWPRPLSDVERAQLSFLGIYCASYCQAALLSDRDFVPMGLGGKPDGTVTQVGGVLLMPSAVENQVQFVLEGLAGRANTLSAIAVAEHAGSAASPVLRLLCEHRNGGAFHVSVPWRRDNAEGIALGAPVIEAIAPVVFRQY